MSTSLYNKYPPHHDFGGRMVLNLGCGNTVYRFPNVINVDKFDICKPELVWDLEKTPMPFGPDHFDHIIANHVFEHLHNWWEMFEECARLLKPNGILEIHVPSSRSDAAMGYRDHVRIINQCSFFGTFENYRNGGNAWAEANSKSVANRMKNVRQVTAIKSKWLSRCPVFVQKWASTHLWNVVMEEGYFFRKVTENEFLDAQENYEKLISGYKSLSV